MELTMLGTGNALVTKCYNTCFTIKTDTTLLLVDGGGGNGILSQLEHKDIALGDIHNIFITHAHTDHIIGVLWVVRVYIQKVLRGFIGEPLHVYGHDKSLMVLRTLCELMLHKKQNAQIGKAVILHELRDGDRFSIGDIGMQCFDIHSERKSSSASSRPSRTGSASAASATSHSTIFPVNMQKAPTCF
jgi:Metal-dependent hydrolases of the beta-lactamase superfamily III